MRVTQPLVQIDPDDFLGLVECGDALGLTALVVRTPPPFRTADGRSWLELIARSGFNGRTSHLAEVVEVLLEAGAEVDAHAAAFLDDVGSLPTNLVPDVRDSRGRTALHLAAERDAADVARALIAAGADPSLRDDSGRSVLEIAAQPSPWRFGVARRVLDVLGEAGVELDPWTAARLGDVAALVGVDVHARDAVGDTLLGVAAEALATKAVAFLLDAGADPSAPDRFGRTPLHRAVARLVERDDLAVPRLLVQRGANRQARDQRGRTPADLASDLRLHLISRWLDPESDL